MSLRQFLIHLLFIIAGTSDPPAFLFGGQGILQERLEIPACRSLGVGREYFFAGTSGNRTQLSVYGGDVGFEDRGGHQPPNHSQIFIGLFWPIQDPVIYTILCFNIFSHFIRIFF